MDRGSGMVSLGYGNYARADRVIAVLPIDEAERGPGRRTYVHVDGVSGPIVASRSERAIVEDVRRALAEFTGNPPEEPARPTEERPRPLFGRRRRVPTR